MVHTGVSVIHIENGFVCDLSFRMRQVLLVLDEPDYQCVVGIHLVKVVPVVGAYNINCVGGDAHIFGKASIIDAPIFINKIKGKIL